MDLYFAFSFLARICSAIGSWLKRKGRKRRPAPDGGREVPNGLLAEHCMVLERTGPSGQRGLGSTSDVGLHDLVWW